MSRRFEADIHPSIAASLQLPLVVRDVGPGDFERRQVELVEEHVAVS